MSMTITTLRHHRAHLANAMAHTAEIGQLEKVNPPTEITRFALEQHDDMLFWELSQANDAIEYCHQLNIASEAKRQHIARIACIRLGRMARQIEGARLP